ADHQATYVGLYQTLQNTAIFALPIVGTLLADMVGLPIALALAGALRLTGATLYVVFGLHKVGRPETAPLT
ncbi:MAG: MFS transporter, partial [Chloroflexaceae bacterium]|nr:MFS transporter [Chloroflexaceae bacterium]